jgi:S1-C subfamily serine protease
LQRVGPRSERALLLASGAAVALVAVLLYRTLSASSPALTQYDIDQAVLHTLAELPPKPSEESQAFATIRPSVVWVRVGAEAPEAERSTGTGVVIVDDGTILTSLHVVAGGGPIEVVFADGSKSEADIVSAQPEQDLAVLKARHIPDDLIPATLASSRGLQPGDKVLAVGFPFGIGPSASAGVISGLGREYRATDGQQILRNLIQFDAAVNPGNSGGPLVTMEGQVIGIVTALLNPSSQRVFIGIGFAVPIETAARGAGQSPF